MRENQSLTDTTGKKSSVKLFIILAVLACMIGAGAYYFVQSSKYETTDNAQLDADIIPIKSSISGYIKEIHFKDNEFVKKGQVLISIDDTDLKTKIAQAQAALENSKAGLISVRNSAFASQSIVTATSFTSNSVEQNIGAAKARLSKSEEDFKRMSNMLNANAATKSQYDAVKAELDINRAQYEVAITQSKAAVAQSKGAMSQAEAQRAQIALSEALVKQREAELNLAKTQFDNATIIAPYDGIVTKRSVENGQYITIGQPLCSVIDNKNLWVTANFKETQVRKIKIGQTVDVKVDAYPDVLISGQIESYIGATGAKFSLLPPDNSTGNFVKIVQRVPVKIKLLDQNKNTDVLLMPGLSAFVKVKTT